MMALRKRDFKPTAYADGRKVMPIDQALRWAYQQELSLLGAEGISPVATNWSVERVDSGSNRNSWDSAILAQYVSPDALEIHKWVQYLELPGWLAIDTDATGLLGSTYEPLAGRGYFEEALPKAANLVTVHARLGTIPDLSDHPMPVAVRHPANGTIPIKRAVTRTGKTCSGGEVSYADQEEVRMARKSGRGGFYPQGSYCEVKYFPDWDQVVQERAEYLVWWLALEWLSINLEHLERISVMPPDLPQRPWQVLDIPTSS